MENKKYTPKPPVDFPGNTPVIMTLDTEPDDAKPTKKGDKYTIFTKEGQVFWADELLMSELKGFNKGDVVAVTREYDYKSKSNNWIVEESSETPKASISSDDKGGSGLAAQVAQNKKDIAELRTLISGKESKEESKEEDDEEKTGEVPF